MQHFKNQHQLQIAFFGLDKTKLIHLYKFRIWMLLSFHQNKHITIQIRAKQTEAELITLKFLQSFIWGKQQFQWKCSNFLKCLKCVIVICHHFNFQIRQKRLKCEPFLAPIEIFLLNWIIRWLIFEIGLFLLKAMSKKREWIAVE